MSQSTPQETGALSAQIQQTRDGFSARASDDIKRIYEAGVDDVLAQGVLDRAVNGGDQAPTFVLPNAQGEEVLLSRLLDKGPVIIVWYRGGWCPYCNLTLRAYQERLSEISALGATLVAISPETPDKASDTVEKSDLAFEVLSDVGNRVARSYGVVFDLTAEVHENYNANFALDAWNTDDSGQLPLAATYVIDATGKVTYAFLHHDYRERAEPTDVLAALRQAVGE